jgi:hypothetical protein
MAQKDSHLKSLVRGRNGAVVAGALSLAMNYYGVEDLDTAMVKEAAQGILGALSVALAAASKIREKYF